MPTDIQPGLLVLHGNRSELLREAVFEWIERQPLAPLEEEVFLVQSNGVAEWLKMALAERQGICAASRVELPARFLWRSFRQALGRAEVPAQSPLDKAALTWRLMHLLPECAGEAVFEPLNGFLRAGDAVRRLQLCDRLAGLYDQYQVYRSDWLAEWERGRDVITSLNGQALPLPEGQRWQAALWRKLLDPLDDRQRLALRPRLHQRFIDAMASGRPLAAPVARRVVLFGMSHLPLQTLQALAALASRSQVLLAVPNPCQYHWADIVPGRELLQMARHRHPHRLGHDLATVPVEDLHVHAHPLLAAWGRQGSDFVRQLDAFDDALSAQQRFAIPKVDLFDDGPGLHLLGQVQAHIRDLLPLAEHPRAALAPDDRSIVFHMAHSAQREVEVLHDQLLALLAAPPGGQPLRPRDIVVMVPDIDTVAPAIRAVFGQYPRSDARFIPFDIADVSDRGHNPLVVAAEWLLQLPLQRCRLTDIRDLLDVPAIAARVGLEPDQLPQLADWMAGAGVRWGLNAEQRSDLGLAACGEQNTWLFGLQRMLLGYASGAVDSGAGFDGIEPYTEVGGLDAGMAGSLAALFDGLLGWWKDASGAFTPVQWAQRARSLLSGLFAPTDEHERLSLGLLHEALTNWLDTCDTAGFDEALPLAAFREAWLQGLDEPTLGRRFLGGGVTFCTLMPMRSIPFEVVCLLGMNDGDYPRAAVRSDFDLMTLPGQSRPGDRSRRDDDRQLLLEAVLSARRVLYLSWTGRNVRDNTELPPSVLVSQLREYLGAGWPEGVLAERTTEHPLQPFSRRYFEGPVSDAQQTNDPLFTFAREWQAAHRPSGGAMEASLFDEAETELSEPLTVARLTRFLANPVKDFFRQRLDVVFSDAGASPPDEESFALDALQQYGIVRELVEAFDVDDARTVTELVHSRLLALQREGRLPMGAFAERARETLAAEVAPMLTAWRDLHRQVPLVAAAQPLRHEHGGVVLDDWLAANESPVGLQLVLDIEPSRLLAGKKRTLRLERLIGPWVKMLAASVCGVDAQGVLVGRDAHVSYHGLPQDEATEALDDLLLAWQEGMRGPLPVACKTALAHVADRDAAGTYEGGFKLSGEVGEPCLARIYPDFEALSDDGRFEALADRLYRPMAEWAATHVEVHPLGEGLFDGDSDREAGDAEGLDD
ncbi:MAG: hypothetical protein RLZZ618_1160 [Pseudomonadota bacterium]